MKSILRSVALPAAFGLFAFWALGCAAGSAKSDKRLSNADVSLISFGSLHGEVAPCGWKSGRKGGLARRAGYIDSLQAHNTPYIHVDLGNFASNRAGVDELTTEFIWDMMKEIGVDACAPGPRELQYWPLLKSFLDEGSIPFISSNLGYLDGGEEKPIGNEYLIFERNGVKVALFALMGGSQFSSARIPEGVEVVFADPFQKAQELVPRLQKEADVVVLLSQMTTPDTGRLLAEIEGIDAALYGNLAPWVERCSKLEHTIINQTGTRGQYVGNLVLIVDPDGEVIDWGSKNEQMAELVPEDEKIAELVAAHEEEVKKIQDEMRQGQQHSPVSESGNE